MNGPSTTPEMDQPPWPAIEEKVGAITQVIRVRQSGATFIVYTSSRKLTVKKMTYDRDPGAYYALLTRLAALSPPFCPRPLATVAVDQSRWYAIFEWITGEQPPFAPGDTPFIWNSALHLLSRMRNCTIIPEWRLELSWLHLLKERLPDDPNAMFILEALGAKLPPGPRTLCHGDFSLQNFIRTADGLALVDWEEMGSAPAGFDAGWMLALARMGHGLLKHADMFEALTGAQFPSSNLIWFETLGLMRLLFRARTLPMEAGVRQALVARVQAASQRCRESMERR